jgi:hypothetical protein
MDKLMAAAPANAAAHRLTKLPSDAGFWVMGGVVESVQLLLTK